MNFPRKCCLLILAFFLQFTYSSSSSSSSSLMDLNEKSIIARSIPKELMNPVVRSQIRQRLRQLKLKNEAALRRRRLLFGGTSANLPSSLSLGLSPQATEQSESNNNKNNIQQQSSSTTEMATSTTNQLLPNNRNCFFSPINCQLPVPLVGIRQRSIKRRIVGQSGPEVGPLFWQVPPEQVEPRENMDEKIPRIGQYIMAMANMMQRQQQQPSLMIIRDERRKRKRRK